MKQITQNQAVEIFNSEKWKTLSTLQLAGFQLYQKYIFCDFETYHDALNESLLRGKRFEKESVRFRLESREELQKEWEQIHNVPEFSQFELLLLK